MLLDQVLFAALPHPMKGLSFLSLLLPCQQLPALHCKLQQQIPAYQNIFHISYIDDIPHY